jgi:hypothetical protein
MNAAHTPGPADMANVGGHQAAWGPKNAHRRLTTPQSDRAVQQHTPEQSYFRASAAGRWAADPGVGAHARVHRIRQDPTGCTDISSVDATSDGFYIDLGGRGATDTAVGRPW